MSGLSDTAASGLSNAALGALVKRSGEPKGGTAHRGLRARGGATKF